MPALVDQINNSKARQILQSWLVSHKAKSGEQLQDVANNLKNEIDQPIKHSAISPWFANNSKQAKLMPVNRAIELKGCYPDFPLEEYLRAFLDFHEEYNPSDQKLSGIYAYIEAYGDIVGYGYLAQDYKEYFSIFTEVENLFRSSLPKTLTEEQNSIIKRALESIMLKEIEYESAANVNTKISNMISKITSINKKLGA